MMEDLLHAFSEYFEAKAEHDKEKSKCEYDWGYFGHCEIERLNRAEMILKDELNSFIDNRVQKVLDEKT